MLKIVPIPFINYILILLNMIHQQSMITWLPASWLWQLLAPLTLKRNLLNYMYIRWKKSRAITLNAPFYWILNPFFNIREKVEICQELNGESGKF